MSSLWSLDCVKTKKQLAIYIRFKGPIKHRYNPYLSWFETMRLDRFCEFRGCQATFFIAGYVPKILRKPRKYMLFPGCDKKLGDLQYFTKLDGEIKGIAAFRVTLRDITT